MEQIHLEQNKTTNKSHGTTRHGSCKLEETQISYELRRKPNVRMWRRRRNINISISKMPTASPQQMALPRQSNNRRKRPDEQTHQCDTEIRKSNTKMEHKHLEMAHLAQIADSLIILYIPLFNLIQKYTSGLSITMSFTITTSDTQTSI